MRSRWITASILASGILGLATLNTACRAGSEASEELASVTVEYVAHACFQIRSSSGSSIMIDPYASRWWLGYDFPEGLDPTDAVLLSHPHSDHDGGKAAERELPWASDTELFTDPGSYEIGDIRVVGIRGKHADPYGKEFGQINTIWRIDVAGLRIVHVGDNRAITDAIVDRLGKVDILMLPIDSDYHILKQAEIEEYRERLAPAILIPMHYRHPDLEIDANSPSGLGDLDGWLAEQHNVRRLQSHTWRTDRSEIPDNPRIWVFEHSPKVTAASEP